MDLCPTIKRLLLEISKLPSAGRIVVFGSVAKQSDNPRDIDVALILNEFNDFQKSMRIDEHKGTAIGLLKLASQNYGWLDPFIVTEPMLTVRNDRANGWMAAKNAKAIKASIRKDGIPLFRFMRDLGLSPLDVDAITSKRVVSLYPDSTDGDGMLITDVIRSPDNSQMIGICKSGAVDVIITAGMISLVAKEGYSMASCGRESVTLIDVPDDLDGDEKQIVAWAVSECRKKEAANHNVSVSDCDLQIGRRMSRSGI